MPNRSTHQMPIATARQEDDITYIAREVTPGVYEDRRISLTDISPSYFTAQLTIPSASVLTLNSVPLQIIGALSISEGIVPLFGFVDFVNVTVPYATNVVAYLGTSALTSTNYVMAFNIDEADGERSIIYPQPAAGLATANMAVGESMWIKVLGGDPTAGDGDLVVTVYYQVV